MHDVVVVGAGASGLMCAQEAAARGLTVLVLEQGPKVGLKILVSGGGRCNFTNLFADPEEHFLSDNRHFCISAMRRFSPWDFVAMVEEHGIAYHEKSLGQLFCDDSARQIADMLLRRTIAAGAEVRTRIAVTDVLPRAGGGFGVQTAQGMVEARKVVLASGGLSLPKIASDLAYHVARQLDLRVVTTRPALVPFTWNAADKPRFETLSGVALDAQVQFGDANFRENILFTHRGLSGPAILQISSHWREGQAVNIDLLPEVNASDWLLAVRQEHPQQLLRVTLKSVLPRRLVDVLIEHWFTDTKLGTLSEAQLTQIGAQLNGWQFQPGGTEGYRTAEVTLGGIDTREVSSKTFEVRKVPDLYAVGEALDVTGWLGGYNFQWAWASGWCCAQHL